MKGYDWRNCSLKDISCEKKFKKASHYSRHLLISFSFIGWLTLGRQAYYEQKCADSKEQSEKELHKCKLISEFGETLLKDPTAYFTEWLVIFTAVLSIFSILQIYFLVKADETASLSANAAVDALRNLERPAIFVTAMRISYSGIANLEFNIRNHGRATAILIDVIATAKVFEKIPMEAVYSPSDAIESLDFAAMPAGSMYEQTCNIVGDIDDLRARVRDKKISLLFYGIIKYTDAFDASFHTKFGFVYKPRDDRMPHKNDVFVAIGANYNERT